MRSKILLVLTLMISLFSTNLVYGNNISTITTGPMSNALAYSARLSAGTNHSLALKSDTTVVGWGSNNSGQRNVADMNGVVAVSAGAYHSLALKSDGTVVARGDDLLGQSSVPAGLNGVVAISAGSIHSLALKSDGTVVAWGDSGNAKKNVPVGLNGVVAVAAGFWHNLALKSDGTVVAWGSNGDQSNVPAGLNGVVAVSAGDIHSLALKSDGTVVAWGYTSVPAGLNGVVAVSARGSHSLALKSDGTVVAWGDNDYGQSDVPSGLNGVLAVSAGESHNLALKSDGTVVAWGRNVSGQTNVPAGLNLLTYIAVDSLSLNKSAITLVKGVTEQLLATITPFYATNKDVTWDSSDSSIATVNSTGLITALNLGTAAITVSTTDGTKTATCIITVTEPPISVVSVSLNKSNATVTKGNTEQLVATVSPTDATNKNVSWVSSNPSIATVDSTGLVTALNPGITAIRVSTSDGNKAATCIITVTEPPISVVSVSLNKSNATVTKGNTEQLVATVSPTNATNKDVTWDSSDLSIATVNSTGLITALNPGTAAITVSTTDGNKTATCIINVTEPYSSVVSVSLNKSNATVTKGNTEQLVATISPSNATNKDVSWVSSNPSIATVDSTGLITALNPGTVAITVSTTDGNKTATCIINVTEPYSSVVSVSLNKTNATVTKGNTEQLVATISPSNATNKNVSWLSSDSSVATVDSTGLVTALNLGTAAITVSTTDGNKTATCIITVTEPYSSVVSVSLNKTYATVTKGNTEQLVATISPTDATNKNVSWVSSDPSIATVTSTGLVTALNLGTAAIRVSTTDGNKTATCIINVTEPYSSVVSVSLNKTNATVTKGNTEQLVATISPSNATNKDVSWVSSNPSIATVDFTGLVTALNPGLTVITVSTSDGNKTATCIITVTEAQISVVSVSLNKSNATVTKGKTEQLVAIVSPSNATNKNVSWVSSDPSVATVDSTGLVTALNPGTAVITVSTTDGNKTATCIITVTEPYSSVVSVSLNKTYATVTKGNTEQLVATISPSNATNKNVSWVSRDPSIAAVDSTGLVTALNPGTTLITVSTIDGNKTATCIITVTEAQISVDSVSLNKSSTTLVKGKTEKLVATVSPSNAANKNVTWRSSDPSVATVDSTGLVMAISLGKNVKITVNTTDGNKQAYCYVTVTDNTAPHLDYPESVSVTFGKTQAVKIYKVQSDDTKVDVTKEVTLVSDDPATATVTRGVIKGISVGDTVVRGNYQGLDIEISVTVTPPVTKLSADPSLLNLIIDGSETITLTATYKNGDQNEVDGPSASWKSSKPKVATVDEYGTVTGVAIGSTTITGTYGGKTTTINVKVTPELDYFLVQPGMVGVSKGKTQIVKIFAVYVNSSKVDITRSIRLTSDDPGVASVTGATIKGITPDCDTVVRGTYLDQDIEISVKVTQPLKKLEADTDTTGLNLGIDDTETINLTAYYADGTDEDVNEYATGISSKPSVATVNIEDGVITVTAVAKGSTTITLSYQGKKVTVKVNVTA